MNKKIQIISYLFMTYLFSWITWGILYASYVGIISYSIYNNYLLLFIVLGGFFPSIMSIIFTGFFYGRDGIKELMKRLTIWKVNPFFYVFVLFFIASSFLIPLLICNITGSSYKFVISTSFINILFNFILTTILGGPLGEELGWRGFILPKLQSKLNPVLASLILAVFWSCWHLPLFFIPKTGQYGIPSIFFFIECIWLSILFTWVYNRTHGSLIMTILFHGSFNTTAPLFINNSSSYFVKSFNKYTIIWILLQFIIILFVILDMIRKPSNHSINIKNN